jgi:hypothetical protein
MRKTLATMTTPEAPPPPPPPPQPMTEAQIATTDEPIQDDYGTRLLAELIAAFCAAPRADDDLREKHAVFSIQLEKARELLRDGSRIEQERSRPAVETLTRLLAELPKFDEPGRRDALVAIINRHPEVTQVRLRLLAEIAPMDKARLRHGLSMAEGQRLDKLRQTLADLNHVDLDIVRAKSELDVLLPAPGAEVLATLERAGKFMRDGASAGRESVVSRVRALADQFATEERDLRALARTATWAELSEALEKYR